VNTLLVPVINLGYSMKHNHFMSLNPLAADEGEGKMKLIRHSSKHKMLCGFGLLQKMVYLKCCLNGRDFRSQFKSAVKVSF
jgi:hypothetical protein